MHILRLREFDLIIFYINLNKSGTLQYKDNLPTKILKFGLFQILQHNLQPWSGAIACQSYNGNWYPMAVFDEPHGACGFKSPIVLYKIGAHIPKLQYIISTADNLFAELIS